MGVFVGSGFFGGRVWGCVFGGLCCVCFVWVIGLVLCD